VRAFWRADRTLALRQLRQIWRGELAQSGSGRFKRTIGCTQVHPTPHDEAIATASHPSAPSRARPSAISFFGFFKSKVMYSHRCIASFVDQLPKLD
jgi:hypothetical protein